MKDTRTTRSNVLNLYVAVAAVALLALGFVALRTVSVGSPVRLVLNRTQTGQIVQAGRPASGANPEGMAIYRQSEHATPARLDLAAGLATYHASEWTSSPAFLAHSAGVSIYHQSETGTLATIRISNPNGWAIYFASEKGR